MTTAATLQRVGFLDPLTLQLHRKPVRQGREGRVSLSPGLTINAPTPQRPDIDGTSPVKSSKVARWPETARGFGFACAVFWPAVSSSFSNTLRQVFDCGNKINKRKTGKNWIKLQGVRRRLGRTLSWLNRWRCCSRLGAGGRPLWRLSQPELAHRTADGSGGRRATDGSVEASA